MQFVVQLHRSRRVHYDLRLEHDGVLKSWAVPKGLSDDPKDKHLAVRTEDHPMDYLRFEGIIPAGEYGAGDMIIWDRGHYSPLLMQEDKWLFELHGQRLQGVWTLFRTKGEQWIVMKKPPDWKDTHKSVEQQLAARPGVPKASLRASSDMLMLAKSVAAPFSDPRFLFELKYDGYRLLCEKDGPRVRLLYRGGGDVTDRFAEIAKAIAQLPCTHAIIDGELVAFDERGKPSFSMLQKRVAGQTKTPMTLMAFDLLALGAHDARTLPLADRKRLLAALVPKTPALRYADHVDEQGEAFFAKVAEAGLEGLMAKRKDSTYRAGRSDDWIKVPVKRTGDFAVMGFALPEGSRTGFAALHLAAAGPVYVGRVGSGFDTKQLQMLRTELEKHRIDAPVCPVPREYAKRSLWVKPTLIVEVRYTEVSPGGHLRQPIFLRVRDDKDSADALPGGGATGQGAHIWQGKKPEVSNPGKVFFPELGLTKKDLVDYYRAIAPWLLPLLADRPVVLTRYPDGIHGKNFFQKDAPDFTHGWLKRLRIYSESTQREIDHFIIDSADALVYVANLASIPLHVWASRSSALERPDWLVIDIDPKLAPFEHVVQIALAAKRLCDRVGLPSYPKTTGSSGLHVLVPLGGACTYAQAKSLAELLCRILVRELPQIATIEREPTKRKGKVYLDYIQNGYGKTIASAFCVRPLPAAPVSMPLHWREVNAALSPQKFTMQNALAHVRAWKENPFTSLLTQKPEILSSLELLKEK